MSATGSRSFAIASGVKRFFDARGQLPFKKKISYPGKISEDLF